MSDHHPTGDISIAVPPPKSAASSTKRIVGFVAAAAVTATAVGAGVLAWRAWADQGAQPAEALPANTLAYVSVDLNPPGGQKIEAFKALRKFPSLKRDLGLGDVDDLRESIVKEISSESGCDFEYSAFKPWIGDRVALALVPQDGPQPVVVAQVGDAAKARIALKKIASDCGEGFGYVVGDEWAVLAQTDAIATQVQSDAGRGTLADDKEFRKLTEAAGDPGLATLYAAPEAGKALLEVREKDPITGYLALQTITTAFDPFISFVPIFGLFALATPEYSESDAAFSSSMEASPDLPPELKAKNDKILKQFENFDELTEKEQDQLLRDQEELYRGTVTDEDVELSENELSNEELEAFEDEEIFPSPDLSPELTKALQDFTGLGGVARIDDGALEVSVVGDILAGTSSDLYGGSNGDALLKDLPADTALVFGAGLSDRWVDAFVSQIQTQFPYGNSDDAKLLASMEKATGLDLPTDLEALDGISVVIGGGFSPVTLFEQPQNAPIALRLGGDRDKVEAALEKIRKRIGAKESAKLISLRLGDDVVVGTNTAYLDQLAKGGDLIGSDSFGDVVPDAKDSTTAYYANFNAGDWLVKAGDTNEDRKNLAPLRTAGMTVTKNGGQQTMLFRLTFD